MEPLLSPAIITLVFRANESGNVARMPAEGKHRSNDLLDSIGLEQQVVGLFKDDPGAGWKFLQDAGGVGL